MEQLESEEKSEECGAQASHLPSAEHSENKGNELCAKEPKSHSCKLCGVKDVNILQYYMHLVGGKHRQRLRQEGLTVPDSEASLLKKGVLHVYMEMQNRKEPIIGLQFVVQFKSTGDSDHPYYFCQLCKVLCQNDAISHVASRTHRFTYIKEIHPDMLPQNLKNPGAIHLLKPIAQTLETKEGMGEVQVQTLSPDDWSKFKTMSLEEIMEKYQVAAFSTKLPSGDSEKCQSDLPVALPFEKNKKIEKLNAQKEVKERKFPCCEICEVVCSSEIQLNMHLNGKKHKLKLKTVQCKENWTAESVGTLKNYVENPKRSEPVVGLKYVTEYRFPDENQVPYYLCSLCKIKMKTGITSHVTSRKHRFIYMKQLHPDSLPFYLNLDQIPKISSFLREKAEILEKTFGRGEYLVEVLPEGDDQKLMTLNYDEALKLLQNRSQKKGKRTSNHVLEDERGPDDSDCRRSSEVQMREERCMDFPSQRHPGRRALDIDRDYWPRRECSEKGLTRYPEYHSRRRSPGDEQGNHYGACREPVDHLKQKPRGRYSSAGFPAHRDKSYFTDFDPYTSRGGSPDPRYPRSHKAQDFITTYERQKYSDDLPSLSKERHPSDADDDKYLLRRKRQRQWEDIPEDRFSEPDNEGLRGEDHSGWKYSEDRAGYRYIRGVKEDKYQLDYKRPRLSASRYSLNEETGTPYPSIARNRILEEPTDNGCPESRIERGHTKLREYVSVAKFSLCVWSSDGNPAGQRSSEDTSGGHYSVNPQEEGVENLQPKCHSNFYSETGIERRRLPEDLPGQRYPEDYTGRNLPGVVWGDRLKEDIPGPCQVEDGSSRKLPPGAGFKEFASGYTEHPSQDRRYSDNTSEPRAVQGLGYERYRLPEDDLGVKSTAGIERYRFVGDTSASRLSSKSPMGLPSKDFERWGMREGPPSSYLAGNTHQESPAESADAAGVWCTESRAGRSYPSYAQTHTLSTGTQRHNLSEDGGTGSRQSFGARDKATACDVQGQVVSEYLRGIRYSAQSVGRGEPGGGQPRGKPTGGASHAGAPGRRDNEEGRRAEEPCWFTHSDTQLGTQPLKAQMSVVYQSCTQRSQEPERAFTLGGKSSNPAAFSPRQHGAGQLRSQDSPTVSIPGLDCISSEQGDSVPATVTTRTARVLQVLEQILMVQPRSSGQRPSASSGL
nr:PREDICTED: uncharacterized protein LOC107078602 isoform X2 [Lepisosteus oculatus]